MQGLMLGGGGMAMNKADEGPVPACPGSVWGIPGRQTLVITMMEVLWH